MRSFLSVPGLYFYLLIAAVARGQAGHIDPTFNPGNGPNGAVRAIVPLSDSSILVGGDFSQWNGNLGGSVVRLRADGSVDSSFDADVSMDVRQLFVQHGGVLVVGANSIVRLLASGARDTNFGSLPVTGPVTATEDYLYTVFVPPRPRPFLEMRAPEGSFIYTLYSGSVGDQAYRLVPYSDNRVFMLGHFSFSQMPLFGPPGTDQNFQAPRARDAWNAVAAPDGSIYAALRFDGTTSDFTLLRLNGNGQADNNFVSVGGTAGEFGNLAVQSDGRLLYGARQVTRLNLDGSVDTTFNPDFANSTIHAIVVQPDGRILVGGALGSIDGQAQPDIVRLLSENSAPEPEPSPTNDPPDTVGFIISGRVTDGTNGIAGVRVTAGRRNSTFTDEGGAYILTVRKKGRFVVRPSLKHARFAPHAQRVRVREDVVLPDFVLRPRRQS
jgi:uncharacterized delta-60 repeat protein